MNSIRCEYILADKKSPTEHFGRFLITPIEKGHGITIGNIFRRVLLTDLAGLSVVGIRIAGVNHEFSSIPGVREDVLEVLLNLKELIFTSDNPKNQSFIARLKIYGPTIVTAGQFQFSSSLKLRNPNQYIATITDSVTLEMEIKIAWGKGYKLMEEKIVNEPLDFLRTDAIFMPVSQVDFKIENIFFENKVSHEDLFLDIWTNGSISPDNALYDASENIINWFQNIQTLLLEETEIRNPISFWDDVPQKFIAKPQLIRENINKIKTSINKIGEEKIQILNNKTSPILSNDQHTKKILEDKYKLYAQLKETVPNNTKKGYAEKTLNEDIDKDIHIYNIKLKNSIKKLNLSKRVLNSLEKENIKLVRDLLKYSKKDLVQIKNFGVKSLEEVTEKLINYLGKEVIEKLEDSSVKKSTKFFLS